MRKLLSLTIAIVSLPIIGCGAPNEEKEHVSPESFSKSDNPQFAPPAGKSPEGASRGVGGK